MSHTSVRGQRGLPSERMDLAEVAGWYERVLFEDGAPKALRLDVIDTAGMLMRELERRVGWDDPEQISTDVLRQSIMAERWRVLSSWPEDCLQLPDFNRWLNAASMLLGFAAHQGRTPRLDPLHIGQLRRELVCPPEAVRFITDREARVLYVDGQLATWCGVQPNELFGADVIEDLVAPGWRAAAREIATQMRAGDDSGAWSPMPLQGHDGELVWVRATSRLPLYDATGAYAATLNGLVLAEDARDLAIGQRLDAAA